MSSKYIAILLMFVHLSCVYSLNEICSKNIECTDTNSICLDGKCTCGPFAYFSSNFKACLTYVTEYGTFCKEDAQCDFFGKNSFCRKNICVCQDNFRWFRGSCQKYANKGEKCTTNNDCYDGADPLALACNETVQQCECSEGFYDRGHDCRRISPEDTADCAFNIDCQNDTLICTRGKCKIPAEYTEDDVDSSFKIAGPVVQEDSGDENSPSCNYDEDCRNIANSRCTNSICQCKPGHYLNKENGNCWPGLTDCESDTDCSDDNSFCYLSTSCICKPGYFYKSGYCVAELGMQGVQTCRNISASVLYDDACYCMNYWYGNYNNRECSKTTVQSSLTCITNEWCNGLGPYSICQNGDIGRECTCNSFAKLDNTTYYCEKISENTNGECSRDKDCFHNQQCVNGGCQCAAGFRNSSGTCLPEIGGSCEEISCDHIANAKCINGICECALDSIGEDNVCMKMANHLYDICQVDAQCARLNFTICELEDGAANKTCICEKDYVDVDIEDNYVCMASKRYGSPCMKSTDCTLVLNRSFLCRNSICQCPVGATLKNGYCSGAVSEFLMGKVLPVGLLLVLYVSRMGSV